MKPRQVVEYFRTYEDEIDMTGWPMYNEFAVRLQWMLF